MVQTAAEIVVIVLMGFIVLCLFSMFAVTLWDKVQYERSRSKEQKIIQVGVVIEPEPAIYPLAKRHGDTGHDLT